MVVLAVMAAGAHTMSIAAPALAQQEQLAPSADAAAVRAVVPNPAAADGMPVPALLGGIVLAFAVGLSAGHLQRRRRAGRRSATAAARPAPGPTPSVPARPAPPPPEPIAPPEPQPLEIAAPEPPVPPPPPPPIRSQGPRILRFRPAPAPPPPEPDEIVAEPAADETVAEPDEIVAEPPADETVAEPDEIVAEPPADEAVAEPAADETVAEPAADETVAAPDEIVAEPSAGETVEEPAASGPLGRAPEVPLRDELPASPESAAAPLAETPEVLRAQAPQKEPAVLPARRFARARPWPQEAETLWTCEVAWKAGYLKSTFRAMAGPPGATRRKSIAESPSLRWTLMTDPEPPTPEMIASVRVLVFALVAAGWERTGSGTAWYAQRFVWRGSGEPGSIEVPDTVESAEPPPR